MHGLLWRAAGESATARSARPLLVLVHGGPTSQALADWQRRVQAFVQRGWNVLQPNYRGSTGYGRAYAQALAGHWGERDVADVAAGIRHADEGRWADAGRVAIMGGSAGGMTALLVAAQHPDLVHAVVALVSGVRSPRPRGDDAPLRVGLHVPHRRAAARSGRHVPRSFADRRARPRSACRCSCCTATRTRRCRSGSRTRCADALRARGRAVEHHVYEGEGHGWRRADTIADDFERVDAFLTRWVFPR